MGHSRRDRQQEIEREAAPAFTVVTLSGARGAALWRWSLSRWDDRAPYAVVTVPAASE